MNKAEWRATLSAKAYGDQAKLDQNVCEFLQTEKGIWAGYRAVGNEPNINNVFTKCGHLRWAFPRVDKDQLQFLIPGPLGFQRSRWGIDEPHQEGSQFVAARDIAGFLIPGVGFDRKGFRLGRGKGFYDKVLQDLKAKKVGIAWKQTIVDELPVESHDIRMDVVVSDESVERY